MVSGDKDRKIPFVARIHSVFRGLLGVKASQKNKERNAKPKGSDKKHSLSDLLLVLLTIMFAFIMIFTISHFSKRIGFCGDEKCDAGECSSCLKDCKFGDCSDKICQTEIAITAKVASIR